MLVQVKETAVLEAQETNLQAMEAAAQEHMSNVSDRIEKAESKLRSDVETLVIKGVDQMEGALREKVFHDVLWTIAAMCGKGRGSPHLVCRSFAFFFLFLFCS